MTPAQEEEVLEVAEEHMVIWTYHYQVDQVRSLFNIKVLLVEMLRSSKSS